MSRSKCVVSRGLVRISVLRLLPLVVAVLVMACVTVPERRVLDRADELSSRPDWVKITSGPSSEAGEVRFVAFVELPGEASKSAALNMADTKVMAEPMRTLVDDFFEQNQLGEDVRHDAAIGTRIISTASKFRPALPTFRIAGRYWERVWIRDADGNERIELHVYALGSVKAGDLERARREFLRDLAGEPEIKKILDEVGRAQREAVGMVAP